MSAVFLSAPVDSRSSAQFEALAGQVRSQAFGLACILTRNAVDAEDLLQSSLLKAWQAFDRYDGRCAFAVWLNVIIRNTFFDRYRAERCRVRLVGWDAAAPNFEGDLPDLDLLDPDGSPEEIVLEHVIHADLIHAIRRLPERNRRVVILCDVLDLDYQECADIEGVPVGTIRSRLFRGRRRLRGILGASYFLR